MQLISYTELVVGRIFGFGKCFTSYVDGLKVLKACVGDFLLHRSSSIFFASLATALCDA